MRALTLIGLALTLCAGCDIETADYHYILLTDPPPHAVTYAKPDLLLYSGDRLPAVYTFVIDDIEFRVSIGDELFVPELEILSIEPDLAVEVDRCGHVFKQSLNEASVRWGATAVRDRVCGTVNSSVQLSLRVGVRKLLLHGVITKGGRFTYFDSF